MIKLNTNPAVGPKSHTQRAGIPNSHWRFKNMPSGNINEHVPQGYFCLFHSHNRKPLQTTGGILSGASPSSSNLTTLSQTGTAICLHSSAYFCNKPQTTPMT